MNNIQRNIILCGLSSILTLAGCAIAPAANKMAGGDALPVVVPSYDERVQSVPMEQMKTAACPTDSKWQSLDWKKISLLANACVKAKDWQQVEKLGNFLAIHAFLTPWGAYYLSLASEGRKDYPRAIWMLELALKKDPKEGLFHYELGRIHWQIGNDSEAIAHLKQASELNPGLADAQFVMGQLSAQNQDISAAEHYFERALRSNAKHLPSLMALVALKVDGKDYVNAEEYLTRVIELNPRSSKARLALAQVQEEHLKKLQEALHNYKQLKQLSAEKKLDEDIHLNLDDKIRNLEKNLTQVNNKGQLTVRTPSGERQVKQ